MTKIITTATILIFLFHLVQAQEKSFADGWEYVGIAVEEPGYTIWGSSPIVDDDGRVHLFVARWPGELKVDPGWRSHSEIAHYVGQSPEGPFEFSDIALVGRGNGHWDAFGPHNPAIHKVGDIYYLLYIANDNPNQPPHPANQQIGLAKSTSLYGPWERIHGNGLILSPPNNPKYWNFNAANGVNNPALLQHPDGGIFLYFKSQGGKMGLAIAENIEGPYVQLPYPVTYNDRSVEDGYAFMMGDQFCLLTTDNHGMLEKGGGILWSSDDGIRFTRAEKGFHPVNKYIESSKLQDRVRHYGGNIVKFERPQVLLINDKPAYMYAPSGYHFFGADATASYVLRRRKGGGS
ncbi:MAG: glycoside hydrolase family protein [Bacteroidota bacterium]|nr:glycoside hydrolase family protein [Bacteroidota bacterium]